MPIGNVVVLVVGFIFFAFILIFYIVNPFKWKFIKRVREDEGTNESVEVYHEGREALVRLLGHIDEIRDLSSVDPFLRYRLGWIAGRPIYTVY